MACDIFLRNAFFDFFYGGGNGTKPLRQLTVEHGGR